MHVAFPSRMGSRWSMVTSVQQRLGRCSQPFVEPACRVSCAFVSVFGSALVGRTVFVIACMVAFPPDRVDLTVVEEMEVITGRLVCRSTCPPL